MSGGTYAKAVMALLVAVATVLVTALGTSPQQTFSNFTTKDWLTTLAAVIATPALTAFVENIPGLAGGIIKAIVAAAGAFITALITGYADNVISQAEWITAFSAALVALSTVYQTTNGVRVTPPNYP